MKNFETLLGKLQKLVIFKNFTLLLSDERLNKMEKNLF